MLIDSHCHLNFGEFEGDWRAVAEEALSCDTAMVVVGSQYATSKKAVDIAASFDAGVYAAVGLHPIHVTGSSFKPEPFEVDAYKALAQSEKVVAIGETGIDFFHDDSNFAQQKTVFEQHIKLSIELKLPLIVHNRNSKDGTKNSYRAVLDIVGRYPEARGVAHCFGGTTAEAHEFVEKGFYVGFTGIVTFDKTGALAETIKALPLERILIETDSPYLAPVPFRGKQNKPLYVKYVAEKIAEIRKLDYHSVVEVTASNAHMLFGIAR